ncbi:MAG TPA: hypothetical protein VEZ48_06260 [Sphingomonadaceae bacterium]|jgi:hypothetical protein|nr:hypothetical protein [Sphingomonadaceae bacterium]
MIAIAAALAALLFMCWILFTLAVYALPFFAAVSAGMLAYQTGSGSPGAAVVALVTGMVALVLGQVLFAATRSPALRATIAVAYAAPAALAGYHAAHGLAAIGSPSTGSHELLSVAGASVIGVVAWSRMSALAEVGPNGASQERGHMSAAQAHRRS